MRIKLDGEWTEDQERTRDEVRKGNLGDNDLLVAQKTFRVDFNKGTLIEMFRERFSQY